MMARKKAAKKSNMCKCGSGCGHGKICMGVVLLLISGMLYLGYGWMEIFGVLGVLTILKGLMHMNK